MSTSLSIRSISTDSQRSPSMNDHEYKFTLKPEHESVLKTIPETVNRKFIYIYNKKTF